MPVAAFYVLAISLVLWIVTEYLPIGRYLYAIGANPRAAELNGIPTRRYVIGAFMASGCLSAIAGVVLAAQLRIGQASVGLEFLLPALVGAFLGSTTIKPGRVNVWGTIVGVAILAVGISGIQQFGGAFYVEPLFNGVTLLIAIGLAGYAQSGVDRYAMRSEQVEQSRPRPATSGTSQQRKSREGRYRRKRTMRSAMRHVTCAFWPCACALSHGGGLACAPMPSPTPRPMSRRSPSRTRPGTVRPPDPGGRAGKTIVYVVGDQRNGGAHGVGEGVQEAAGKIGWTFRHTSTARARSSGRAQAMNQAIALKPDVIVLGGIDATEQAAASRRQPSRASSLVGWHSSAEPGPHRQAADLHQHHHRSRSRSPRQRRRMRCARLRRQGGAVIFTDSAYEIAIAKVGRHGRGDQGVRRLQGPRDRGHAAGRRRNRMPQLTTSLLQRYGKNWTHALSINDLTFDFMAPSLAAAGIKRRRHRTQHLRRRRQRGRLPAHPRRRVPGRQRWPSRCGCRAGSSSTRRTAPSQGEAQRLRRARATCSCRRTSSSMAGQQHLRPGQRLSRAYLKIWNVGS